MMDTRVRNLSQVYWQANKSSTDNKHFLANRISDRRTRPNFRQKSLCCIVMRAFDIFFWLSGGCRSWTLTIPSFLITPRCSSDPRCGLANRLGLGIRQQHPSLWGNERPWRQPCHDSSCHTPEREEGGSWKEVCGWHMRCMLREPTAAPCLAYVTDCASCLWPTAAAWGVQEAFLQADHFLLPRRFRWVYMHGVRTNFDNKKANFTLE
jgi:hypothetical protein